MDAREIAIAFTSLLIVRDLYNIYPVMLFGNLDVDAIDLSFFFLFQVLFVTKIKDFSKVLIL